MSVKRSGSDVWKRLKKIPHFFSKAAVAWCIGCGTVCCFYALRILSRTGHDPSALLAVILAFFGGELMMMCLKTITGSKKNTEE